MGGPKILWRKAYAGPNPAPHHDDPQIEVLIGKRVIASVVYDDVSYALLSESSAEFRLPRGIGDQDLST